MSGNYWEPQSVKPSRHRKGISDPNEMLHEPWPVMRPMKGAPSERESD